jgi:hypothetical protein
MCVVTLRSCDWISVIYERSNPKTRTNYLPDEFKRNEDLGPEKEAVVSKTPRTWSKHRNLLDWRKHHEKPIKHWQTSIFVPANSTSGLLAVHMRHSSLSSQNVDSILFCRTERVCSLDTVVSFCNTFFYIRFRSWNRSGAETNLAYFNLSRIFVVATRHFQGCDGQVAQTVLWFGSGRAGPGSKQQIV